MPKNPSAIGGLSLGPTQGVLNEMMWAIGILTAEKKILKAVTYDPPGVILERLAALEQEIGAGRVALEGLLGGK